MCTLSGAEEKLSSVPVLHPPHAVLPKSHRLKEHGTEPGKSILFGSISGALAMCIEYPFDTVKVRLQSRSELRSPIDVLRAASRSSEGLAYSLYRGVSAPMLGAAVETASLFFSYQLLRDTVSELTNGTNMYTQERRNSVDCSPSESIWLKLGCGGIAGAFTSMLLTPIELIKCQAQVPKLAATTQNLSKPPPRRLGCIALYIVRSHGILGLWRGQSGTLIRETGGSAAWFSVYEAMRDMRYGQGDNDRQVWQQICAGASAGVAYHTVCFPADTVKSRMQTESVGSIPAMNSRLVQVAGDVWRQGGIRGFYRGYGVTLLRSAPGSAVIFATYEMLTTWFM